MAGYYPLPAYNPGNALNFEPLNNAVSGFKEAQSRNALLGYQQQRDQVSDQRQNALLRMQENQETRAQTTFTQEQQDRAHKALAATFQAIGQDPDPSRRAALYNQVRGRVKDFDQDIISAGGDPNDMEGTMRLVTAHALGYQQPKAPEVKEVNGRLVRVEPGATGATEIYNAANQPGGAFANPKDKANVEESLRREYATLAKPYFEVRDAYSRVEQSAANPSAAGDLALIFNYMKMLDPGSVVREGEFATAQSAAGIPDRVWNLYNRMLSGERLNPQQREDFIGQARGLFQRQEQQYQGIQEQYRGIAERTGVDTRNTILDFGRPASPNAQSEPSSISGMSDAPVLSPEQARTMPPGTVFRTPDGRVMRVPGGR
jgi:hypothetical protein